MAHESFHRPSTLTNRAVSVAERFCKPRTITQDHIDRWRSDTLQVLEKMDGFNPDVAERITSDTRWNLVKGNPPEDSWYGIVEFDDQGIEIPEVTMYENSTVSRLPSNYLFEVTGQSGMDHLYGHLYPYHAGNEDFGEEAACRLQQGIAQTRKRHFNRHGIAPLLLPTLYKLHKQIPYSNYRGNIVLPEYRDA